LQTYSIEEGRANGLRLECTWLGRGKCVFWRWSVAGDAFGVGASGL